VYDIEPSIQQYEREGIMGTREPRIGDKVVYFGKQLEIVGLGKGEILAKDCGNNVSRLDRRNEGIEWDFINAAGRLGQCLPKPFGAQRGVRIMQNQQKKAYQGMVLLHQPVPGIPETTADIKTTLVVEPQVVLATNQATAEATLLRLVPPTVNVEYVEVLCKEF